MIELTQADLDHANLVWGHSPGCAASADGATLIYHGAKTNRSERWLIQGNWIGCDDCGGVADAEHHPGCSGGGQMNFPAEITLDRHTISPRCECGWTVDTDGHQHYFAWKHVFHCHMPVTWIGNDRALHSPYVLLLSEAAISYRGVTPDPTLRGKIRLKIRRTIVMSLNHWLR